MAVESSVLTPQQRLAISRRALFNQFEDVLDDDAIDPTAVRRNERVPTDPEPPFIASHATGVKGRGFLDGYISGFPALSVARNIGERWWRRHPANAVVQLARPVLGRYARQKPAKLVAIAAGAGALIVLLKPWRLLSVTALMAAALKTSDVADMVTTLMHRNENGNFD